ncbi:50S ribosomal protein L36 [Amycolatopsis cynarae]|uniref:50S ribosomal protein L36 n=1 Tax=Amycolatopsis cynarae TaxID=2995223 RepID=A0ABY7B7D8_9PSEU|nr:50S ribosomal protein L36 [Amycolatopsis sp. HUAS 11-8]WAL68246.1 50S ribosomal protein L36 [Amycolatopsis sp. HUAS 11-8]
MRVRSTVRSLKGGPGSPVARRRGKVLFASKENPR